MAIPPNLPSTSWPAWWRQWALFRHPSALLLLAQLLEIVVYPATEGARAGSVLMTALGIVVLLTTLRLINDTRGFVWYALAVAALAIGLNIGWSVLGWPVLEIGHAAAAALLYFYAALCMIRYMLADRRATTDELFAAAATFTLLVWAFMQLLVLCQLLQPAAFADPSQSLEQGARSWSELMFLSFALFTSTGIGGTFPMTAASRTIGALEMFAGVMYLALVVSRLIGIASVGRCAAPR